MSKFSMQHNQKSDRKPFWRGLSIRRMMAIVAACSLLLGALAYQIQIGREHLEAARRSQCLNHLRGFGIDLHSYESRHGGFPVGTLPNPDLPLDRRLGWMNKLEFPQHHHPGIRTLPDLDSAWDDPGLLPFSTESAGGFACRSVRSVGPGAPSPLSYLGIGGLGIDGPSLPTSHPRAGFFNDHQAVKIADITDGLANTMAVAETTSSCGPWIAGGRRTVRGLDPAGQPYLGVGRQFGSYHPKGVNILMADGSVRTLSATVDPKIFEAMSTIAGGEMVSALAPK